jgi:hypothetical protein
MRDQVRPVSLIIFLALVAIGYLAGSSDSRGTAKTAMRTLSAANVLLEYPSRWRRAAASPQIPGLSVSNAVVLAPQGESAPVGLLVGQTSEREASPLPASFLARMAHPPETQIVNLLEIEAYKYSDVSIPGFGRTLTIYSIPNPLNGSGTVLACYAPAADSSDMRACQQIVATATLVGQSQLYELTPEPAYARELSSSLAALNGQRVALRRELAARTAPATAQRAASRCAEAFAIAGTSLSALEPPSAVHQAQTALADSISTARDAYAMLASAAAETNAARFALARNDVYQAEASVNGALERFALLDY